MSGMVPIVKVVAVLGNVTPHRGLLSAIRWFLNNGLPAEANSELIDLSDKQMRFGFRKPGFHDDTAEVFARLQGADAVIFATPAYEGGLGDSLTTLLYNLSRSKRSIEAGGNHGGGWHAG